MKRGTELKAKFKTLQRRLRLPLWQVKGLLQALWDFTAENAPRGDVGRFSNADIADAIEYDGDADNLILTLRETRWLDACGRNRLVVHDWADHAEDWIRKRVARMNPPGFAVVETPAPTPAAVQNSADNGGQCPKVADDGGQRQTTAENGEFRRAYPVPEPVPEPMPVPGGCKGGIAADAALPPDGGVRAVDHSEGEDEEGADSLRPSRPRGSAREIGEAFRLMWGMNRGSLPAVKTMTPKRDAACVARLRSKALRDEGLVVVDDYAEIVQFLAADDFYSGKTARGGWTATLDWLVKCDDNVLKALEKMRSAPASAEKESWEAFVERGPSDDQIREIMREVGLMPDANGAHAENGSAAQ